MSDGKERTVPEQAGLDIAEGYRILQQRPASPDDKFGMLETAAARDQLARGIADALKWINPEGKARK